MRYTITPVMATYSQIGKVILAIFLCSVNLPNLAFIKVTNTKGITITESTIRVNIIFFIYFFISVIQWCLILLGIIHSMYC